MNLIKNILKISSMLFTIMTVISTISIIILYRDAQEIKKLQQNQSIFILTEKGQILSILKIEKMVESSFISPQEAENNPSFFEGDIFYVTIQAEAIKESTLPLSREEIGFLNEWNKEEIYKEIIDITTPQEVKDALFISSFPTIMLMNPGDPEAVSNFIYLYEKRLIKTNPPMKALEFFIKVPEKWKEKALSALPLLQQMNT